MRKSAGEKYVGFADQGAAIKATELLDIYQRVARFREETALALGDYDVIVTPTCACMPWPAVVAFPTEIDGKPVGPRGSAVYSGWVNAARIPAINVPAALSDTGLPIGVQFVAAYGSDQLLMQLAGQYEQARPWSDHWPTMVEQSL